MKSIFLAAMGSLFILLGVIGLALPFLPGFLFFLVAAVCFANLSPALRGYMSRHPRLRLFFHRVDAGAGLAMTARLKLAFWACLEAINPQQKPHWQRYSNKK